MTRYVINRFATVDLPTFNPDWRDLCDRCVSKTSVGPGTKDSAPKVVRCSAAPREQHGKPACSAVRHAACKNGELFRERIA